MVVCFFAMIAMPANNSLMAKLLVIIDWFFHSKKFLQREKNFQPKIFKKISTLSGRWTTISNIFNLFCIFTFLLMIRNQWLFLIIALLGKVLMRLFFKLQNNSKSKVRLIIRVSVASTCKSTYLPGTEIHYKACRNSSTLSFLLIWALHGIFGIYLSFLIHLFNTIDRFTMFEW